MWIFSSLKLNLWNLAPTSSWFYVCIIVVMPMGLPRWLSGKEYTLPCRRHRRHEFDPVSGRFPGGGNGNPLQNCCLGNLMDRGTWQLPSMGSKSDRHDLVTEHARTHNEYSFSSTIGNYWYQLHCAPLKAICWTLTTSNVTVFADRAFKEIS